MISVLWNRIFSLPNKIPSLSKNYFLYTTKYFFSPKKIFLYRTKETKNTFFCHTFFTPQNTFFTKQNTLITQQNTFFANHLFYTTKHTCYQNKTPNTCDGGWKDTCCAQKIHFYAKKMFCLVK